jgi:hypothetical protein
MGQLPRFDARERASKLHFPTRYSVVKELSSREETMLPMQSSKSEARASGSEHGMVPSESVELDGIEPTTSGLQSPRSPS